ncbi:cyclin-dependent kinase 9 [Caerostris darwini]|uniref:Cyclin-dependent kinase 9 n=1 Tax=Caerostris darwini TaxID=1538125 RepID=A0AAV4TEX7_9ARAC|nr:cyclin-dependent kinase 9 [Caerostris darwini]
MERGWHGVPIDHEKVYGPTQGASNDFRETDISRLERELEEGWHPENLECTDVSKYRILSKIGQGSYGEVFKAVNQSTRQVVALKKILTENEAEGFPITALREVKILQHLKQENVVNLIEICFSKVACLRFPKTTFYLVLDYCEYDLGRLIYNPKINFTLEDIKTIMKQLLNSLYFIHSSKVLHRDVKPTNILVTGNGIIKLADFGLARAFSSNKPKNYTNGVVTLWYRSPELLLGERNYGPPIDIWAAGCTMAEIFLRNPVMQGDTEQQQIMLICDLCGSIEPETFPGCEKLDLYQKMELPKGIKRSLREKMTGFIKEQRAIDLLDRMLNMDPHRRIDSDTALNHDFFWSDPMPNNDLSKTLSVLYSQEPRAKKTRFAKYQESTAHPVEDHDQYYDRVF